MLATRYSLLATLKDQPSRKATPGRIFPSRNSKLAPPPVEQWVTLSATLNFFAAVAVSPPPTTVVAPFAVASATASAIALVAPANFSNSNTPGGPFQIIVFARRMASRYSSRDFGPASNPCQPAGIPLVSVAAWVFAFGSNLSAQT